MPAMHSLCGRHIIESHCILVFGDQNGDLAKPMSSHERKIICSSAGTSYGAYTSTLVPKECNIFFQGWRLPPKASKGLSHNPQSGE